MSRVQKGLVAALIPLCLLIFGADMGGAQQAD